MIIEFSIPGLPIAWPRATPVVRWYGKTPRAAMVTVKGPHDNHQKKIAAAASFAFSDPVLRCPVGLVLDFVFPRIKGQRTPDRAPMRDVPDLDNLEKMVMDAIKGVIINDDRQVVSCLKNKWYAAESESPFTHVKVCTTKDDFDYLTTELEGQTDGHA